ncbi:unnamed protein product [Lymnaea stagnalis]|uniref:Uncharacterized protein n=1 Tax=Lymnaea stagnalis TaxID=6523 RepID=A0AAV2HI61_LYMST
MSPLGALLLLYGVTQLNACFISLGSNGSYNLSATSNGTWLRNGPYAFNLDGKWRTLANGSLTVGNASSAIQSSDEVGAYTGNMWTLTADNVTMEVVFRDYSSPDIPAIMFIQRFPQGLQGSAVDMERTISAFPSFRIIDADTPLGFLSYGGLMLGDMERKTGKWNAQAKLNSGLSGSGPLSVFDRQGNAMVISTYNNFMAASQWQDQASGTLNYGIMGGVDSLPPGFELKTFAFCSTTGIGDAFTGWGDVMRRVNNKTDDVISSHKSSDLSLTHLGYWTDNGAYYYYVTETNKNYQDTLLDVQHYSYQSRIPYKYFQLDSWFYPKDDILAVTTWLAMETIFPKGLQPFQSALKLPLVAHNRYWSKNVTYAKQNGGTFDFLIEANVSLPISEDFWDYLFGEAHRTWGLQVYEQDWLNVQFLSTNGLKTDLGLGRQWLTQMGKAAEKYGMKIQYCMSLPRHALQSLELPAVTQARASDDYHLGEDQWKIGVTSHLADALGLAPSKDTFWTINHPVNNRYNKSEANPTLQVVTAVLSTGPVGPGDIVGGTNRTILMGCCDEEGLILKPSRPARAIDDQILEMAFNDGKGATGELWSTYSTVDSLLYGVILAANLRSDYVITPGKAGFDLTNPVAFQGSLLYTIDSTGHVSTYAFNDTDSYTINSTTCRTNGENFCLFYTAPVIGFGDDSIVFLGDLTKWVPMSERRVVQVWQTLFDVTVAVRGRPGDDVQFSYLFNGQRKDLTEKVNNLGCGLFIVASSNNSMSHTRKRRDQPDPKSYDCRFYPSPSTTTPPPLSPSSTPTSPKTTTAKSSSTTASSPNSNLTSIKPFTTTHKGVSPSLHKTSALLGAMALLALIAV